MEFTEAESNMNDLISEYQQYQGAPVLAILILFQFLLKKQRLMTKLNMKAKKLLNSSPRPKE